MPTTEVTLYTSIQPQLKRPVRGRDFGPAWQRTCIGSWKAAGFRIVSLNAPAELEALRSLEPIVEFQQIAADRKRPTITDFFAAAANSANRVVGIINGDCLIIQQMNLVDRLSRGIDGIAIVERLNIDQQTLRPSGRPCMGFDAFFFEPASLARVKHDSFWLLGGWWVDYWLPFAFHTAGLKIWTLPARSLIHLDHDIPRAWGEDWNNATLRLTDFLLNAGKQGLLDPTLTKNLSSAARKDDRAALLQLLFFWLRSQEPLWISGIWQRRGIVDEHGQRLCNVPSTPATRAILQMESNCPSAAQLPEVSDGNSWVAAHISHAWSCQASRD